MLLKLLKFCIVGGSGMVIDFAVTFFAKEKLHINKYIANSLGFIFAASSNYILNRIWTFQSDNPEITQQYIQFIGISAIGLGLNNLIVYILSDKANLNFYLSKLIAIVCVTAWNFLMNYFFTFN